MLDNLVGDIRVGLWRGLPVCLGHLCSQNLGRIRREHDAEPPREGIERHGHLSRIGQVLKRAHQYVRRIVVIDDLVRNGIVGNAILIGMACRGTPADVEQLRLLRCFLTKLAHHGMRNQVARGKEHGFVLVEPGIVSIAVAGAGRFQA